MSKKILCIVLALVICAGAVVVGLRANGTIRELNTEVKALELALQDSQNKVNEAGLTIAQLEADTLQLEAAKTAVEAAKSENAASAAALETANAALETAGADLEAANSALEAANARIGELETAAAEAPSAEDVAELQAQVDLYKPFYDAQVIIEFDGGVVFLEDVMKEYGYIESMYAQYGVSLDDYGYAAEFKQDTALGILQSAVIEAKARELGLYDIDEETLASLAEVAASDYQVYLDSAKEYFVSETATEEQILEQATAFLDSAGYTEQVMLDTLIDSYVGDNLYEYIVADVAVTDEDLQAAYDALVAEQQETLTDDFNYCSSRTNGETIAWNPEGYRAVKHVLVKFTDEQAAAYDELVDTIASLEAELAALETAAAEETPAEETAADETAADETAVDETAADEETVAARTAEEINADLAAVKADLEALYAELAPRAQEVVDKFNAGTSFEDLIAEYNEDPGMTNEPSATIGYSVCATSTTWDPAFTEGAMSIESVGGISEPVYGMNGIHIIHYEFDIPAGAVDIAEISDELSEDAYKTKRAAVYTETIESWVTGSNPVYHFDRIP